MVFLNAEGQVQIWCKVFIEGVTGEESSDRVLSAKTNVWEGPLERSCIIKRKKVVPFEEHESELCLCRSCVYQSIDPVPADPVDFPLLGKE